MATLAKNERIASPVIRSFVLIGERLPNDLYAYPITAPMNRVLITEPGVIGSFTKGSLP